jgi:hypothetical protein
MHNKKSLISGLFTQYSALSTVLRLTTIYLLLFFSSYTVRAQVYPINVTTQLIPPYSVDLVNYAAPGCEQLRVMVTQLNLTQSYSIRLQMDIQLNGKSIIRTSAQYAPPPIMLSPGQTLVISGSDLYPYLDPRNMDFVGYSKESYMLTKCLPEGFYTITFTAINYDLPYKVLSQGGSMYCYLAKADPPQLNLPFNHASVTALSSQFVNFQWLPRNIASPNATQTITYKLELFEIRPEGRTPNDIVQSTKPIYTSETTLPSLNYTIADPPLEVGMHYAWRIRATEENGLDRIRNNGYSEVYSFTYGGDATNQPGSKVQNLQVEAVAPTRAKLTWDPSTDFDGYKTRYRKSGGNFIWYEDETVKNNFDVFKLTPEETYEFQVQGRKGTIWGGFSDSKTIKMPACQVIKCGDPYKAPTITNRTPIDELRPLQEINVGGFTMTVLEAKGGNGRFTGKGFMEVPLFGNAKIRCTFNNILVNTDYQLVEGTTPLVTDWKNNTIWDIDQKFEGHTTQVIKGTGDVSMILPDVVIPNAQAINLDTANYDLVIITADGDTVRADVSQYMDDKSLPTLTFTVQDKEGNLYSIDKQTGEATAMGKVPSNKNGTSPNIASPNRIAADRAVVTFDSISGETYYAFDRRKKEYAPCNLIYGEYKTLENVSGTPYDIPYKFIPVGTSDAVKASISIKEKGLKYQNIRFITGEGMQLNADSIADGEYKLTIPSGQDKDGLEVYAVCPQKSNPDQNDVVGKLIVISHTVKQPKVVLVPVNGNTIDEGKVKDELDKIFIAVGIDWQVSSDESNFESTTDSLNVKGSGLFSMYTSGMQNLNEAFIQHKVGSFDQSAAYLFILETKVNDCSDCLGDMPRSKQFGYIFKSKDNTDYKTIAHELAHGIFHLSHTFDSKYNIPQGNTDNLMDYASGTGITKHQWDGIHDPGLVIGMFESDENSEFEHNELKLKILFEKIRYAYVTKENLDLTFADFGETLKGSLGYNPVLSTSKLTMLYGSFRDIEVNFPEKAEFGSVLLNPTIEKRGGYSIININTYASEIVHGPHNIEIQVNNNDAQALYNYLFPAIDLNAWQEKAKYLIAGSQNDMLSYPSEAFGNMYIGYRMRLLNFLAETNLTENWFGSANKEKMVIEIIKTTPVKDVVTLFDKLRQNDLIAKLDDKMGNIGGQDNYTDFCMELFKLYKKGYLNQLISSKNLKSRHLKWHVVSFNSPPYIIKYDNGNQLVITDNFNSRNKLTVDPFNTVFLLECESPLLGIEHSQPFPVPAFFFRWIENEWDNRSSFAQIDLTVDIVSLMDGVTEFKKAYKAREVIKGIYAALVVGKSSVDLITRFSNAVFDKKTKEIIEKYPGGRFFLEQWEGVEPYVELGIYGEGLTTTSELKAFASFAAAWKFLKANSDLAEELEGEKLNIINELSTHIEELLQENEQ